MPARILVNCDCPARVQLGDRHEMCHGSLTWHVDLAVVIELFYGQSDAYLLNEKF